MPKVPMTAHNTKGIVLNRTNYGESDRILSIVTKDFGKISVIAKGSRKEKSKLAGGIELLGVNEISFIRGRGEISTLVSARLLMHYGGFIGDLEKMQFAYGCLKKLNLITNDTSDADYFIIAEQLLSFLDNSSLSMPIIELWWRVRLSELMGHGINSKKLCNGQQFIEGQRYVFNITSGGFDVDDNGEINSNHIKLIRVASAHSPEIIAKIKGVHALSKQLLPSLRDFTEYVH